MQRRRLMLAGPVPVLAVPILAMPILAMPILAMPAITRAEAWPDRPIRIIVPSPPGDGSDSTARLWGHYLSEALGQPIVIENRPGAGGRIGTEVAARAAPDGHTLVIGNAGSHGINPATQKDLPYDVPTAFAPVALLVEAPNVLVVNRKALPVASVEALIAAAKARPGALDFASGGPGSSAHMSMELLKARAGIDLLHVPFRGAGAGLQALASGQPPVMFVNLPPALGFIRRGELAALAVTSVSRSPDLPDIPTVAETLPGFETVAWFGLLAPAGTPRPIIDRLHALCAEIGKRPDIVEKIRLIGGSVRDDGPEAFHARIRADITKWRDLVRTANIVVE
jgi:tripartite-type tricarboxylate transporter receptor subunit TctC